MPTNNTYNKCYVVQSEGVIRAYDRLPNYNVTANFRDYYINSDYIYKDGAQSWSSYSTLHVCLDNNIITDNYFYRLDIDKILIIFIIIFVFCFYFPFKIVSRAFGRWLKL